MSRSYSEFNSGSLEALISADQLQQRVKVLGQEIASDYSGLNPLVIGMLKTANQFHADLVRAIDVQLSVEFMAISSYGTSLRTSGEVRILKDLDVAIEGRHVLVVENLIDTGLVHSYLMANLMSRGVASIKLVALLDKFELREKEVSIDYSGFKIPDTFVVGYGLDFADRYSNLPFLAVLKENKHQEPGLIIPSV